MKTAVKKYLDRHVDPYDEKGAAGYIFLWLMGVPASVLFLIFLARGCN